MSDDSSKPWQLVVGGGSAMAIVVALLLNTSKDAQVAISVAEQHGAELLEVRTELSYLRKYITDRTQSRYTATDAARDLKYIQKELEHIEESVEKLQVKHE